MRAESWKNIDFFQKCFILLFSICFDEYNLTLVNRYRIVNRLVEDSQDELLALDVKNLLSNCLSEFVLLSLQIFVLNLMDLIMVFKIHIKDFQLIKNQIICHCSSRCFFVIARWCQNF